MKKQPLNLALQGGGSHGAFTWGVLDRLLEEESLEIKGISGTSAGAINAALTASGLVNGGQNAAKEKLDGFWTAVSEIPTPHKLMSMFQGEDHTKLIDNFFPYQISPMFSPYVFNPLNIDPLRDLFKTFVDFECLRKTDKVKVYISATNVETNQIKVFDNLDICEESLLGSATLPSVRQAAKWGDEFFWDGGYMGNPILEPLIYNQLSKDLLIIQVNPIRKPGVPKTIHEILNRLNEITFNSSLMREIRNIINIQKLSETQLCTPQNPYAQLRLHCIEDEKFMATLGGTSKDNTNLDFLKTLKEKGREAASLWLDTHLKGVGVKTTMDLSNWEMGSPSSRSLQKI